jgi:thiamine-phosphate pyrophosphorylase
MPRHPTAPLNPSIYLVTDSVMCGRLGVAATVSAAVGAGATVVQLRDENATDDELVSLGRELVAVLAGTDVPLIVNDRVHLVAAMGAQGAHVGQSDLDFDQARAMLGPSAYLGLSVQTVEHVEAARERGLGRLDYLGVGPVFETTTKLDAATPGGLERLHQIASASPWPCVAIGGITLERLPDVHRAGAAGAAVVSGICGQPDVAVATRALRDAWDGASV